VPTYIDLEEDFENFNRPDYTEHSEASSKPQVTACVSVNQEGSDVPEGMVIQKNMPNLLALLETRAEGASLAVIIDLRPPTPLPAQTSPSKPREKKRKKDKRTKKKGSEEGEI